MNILLSLIAVLAMTSPVQDQSARIDTDMPAYWSSDEGWRVFSYPDEEMCDLGFPTQSNEYVTVGLHAKENAVNLLVTNKHATSIRAGELKQLIVAFMPAPGTKPTSVNTLAFTVVEADGQKALSATSTYSKFLDDFSHAGVMVVLTPQMSAVAAIRMTGSAEAVSQLRACAMAAAKLDPKDPFLRH